MTEEGLVRYRARKLGLGLPGHQPANVNYAVSQTLVHSRPQLDTPQLHLVLVSREDPALPLARLRARDRLTELHAADLRFTSAEAAAFLREVIGLALAAEQTALLAARTEGWAAGLQLAAFSLGDAADVAEGKFAMNLVLGLATTVAFGLIGFIVYQSSQPVMIEHPVRAG